MQDQTGLSKTIENYLVGSDRLMRSNSTFETQPTILRESIYTEQYQFWFNEHQGRDAQINEKMYEDGFVYEGPHDMLVLGIHKNIKIADISWGLIAEIEEQEAFAAAYQLQKIVIILTIATFLIILSLSVLIAQRIVHPLRVLSETTRCVAEGQYDQEISVRAHNEIGDLATSFREMLVALRDAKKAADTEDWLKTGQNRA